MRKILKIVLVFSFAAVILAGCATQSAYFRLDSTLQKEIRVFGKTDYLSLDRVCDTYGITREWDPYIQTALLRKGSNTIVIRAGGDRILLNGNFEKIDKPILLREGVVFVPVSFVREKIGPIALSAPAQRREPPQREDRKFFVKTIVIDAGHGGHDAGAISRRMRLREKNLALKLAKKLKSNLEREGFKVIMTRDRDIYVPLKKRAAIANNSGADLFVSVHINASRSRSLSGFECYYLSNATDDNARAVEALENASLRLGESAAAEHSSALDKTLWDMALTENRAESAGLAGYICDAVGNASVIKVRGVKSARFYVLKYTRMPSVLIETCYMSNIYDEKKLKDEAFLDKMADAYTKGILKYRGEYERTGGFTNT